MTLAIISALLPLLLNFLEQWQAGAPDRKKEKKYDELNQKRADVVGGNAGAVSMRIDRLLSEETGATGNHAGIENNQPGSGLDSTLERLAALGIGDGKTS